MRLILRIIILALCLPSLSAWAELCHMPEAQAESEFMGHSMSSHEHFALKAMSHSDIGDHSNDGHSGTMPCCDESSQCEHGHCGMTFALLSDPPLSATQIADIPFQRFNISLLSQSYDILLPPPAA